jgi:hypothetical protein
VALFSWHSRECQRWLLRPWNLVWSRL